MRACSSECTCCPEHVALSCCALRQCSREGILPSNLQRLVFYCMACPGHFQFKVCDTVLNPAVNSQSMEDCEELVLACMCHSSCRLLAPLSAIATCAWPRYTWIPALCTLTALCSCLAARLLLARPTQLTDSKTPYSSNTANSLRGHYQQLVTCLSSRPCLTRFLPFRSWQNNPDGQECKTYRLWEAT